MKVWIKNAFMSIKYSMRKLKSPRREINLTDSIFGPSRNLCIESYDFFYLLSALVKFGECILFCDKVSC